MLITSSQISIALSSSVVFTFTTLLFLSGYILQQQTLHSLQAAIHPKPPPLPTPTTSITITHFSRPAGHTFYDKYLSANRPKGGWAKVAYVQLVREHIHLCNALIIFAELESQDSLAQRILFYPQDWDTKEQEKKKADPDTERRRHTTRRLLREASKRYHVLLQPMPPSTHDSSSSSSSTTPLSPEELYPLLPLLSLHHYTRLLYLPPSGLLLDASALDLLFTFPMDSPLLGLTPPFPATQEGKNRGAEEPPLILIQPSKETYRQTQLSLPEGTYPDTDFLSLIPTAPSPSTPPEPYPLLTQSSLLHYHNPNTNPTDPPFSFNSTLFLTSTAYIRLLDPSLPGPEFSVRKEEVEKARPAGREEGRAWEECYRRFREGRMSVCGVDLEVWDDE